MGIVGLDRSFVGRMVDRTTDRTDTFVREVDEELRREQLQKFWNQYGIYAMGFAALLVLGVGGYNWNESRRVAAREAAGARFEAALKLSADGKSAEAQDAFANLAKEAPAGYQALARLQVAGSQARAGKTAEAVADYEALGKDANLDPIMQEFASLQAAMLRLDTADWTEMENWLTPLLTDKSTWRGMARETLGVAAFKAGKTVEARKLFEELLGDKSAPPSATERATLMLALLTDAEAAKAAPVTATPVTKDPEKTKEPEKGAATPAGQKAPANQKK